MQHTLFCFVSQSSVQGGTCGQIWIWGIKKDCFSVGVGWLEGDSSFNFSIMLTHLFHFVVVVVVVSVCVREPVLLPIARHGNRNSL